MKSAIYAIISVIIATQVSGCYMYHDRAKVLLDGVDVDQTLKIAELELQENKLTSVLGYWAVRDQIFTPAQAAEANRLYFKYIDKIDNETHKARGFSVWHFTWAVSNIYRHGDEAVQAAIEDAYQDAAVRVQKLDSRAATKHFGGEEMLMGDAHFMGRSYAKKHVVVPGNKKYVQSFDAYKAAIQEKED